MQQARRYTVEGMVQGVGFRFFVERVAGQLGVGGYVKNRRDGRVEVYAIGAPEKLEELKRRLEVGPRSAQVQRVLEEEASLLERYKDHFTVEFEGGRW